MTIRNMLAILGQIQPEPVPPVRLGLILQYGYQAGNVTSLRLNYAGTPTGPRMRLNYRGGAYLQHPDPSTPGVYRVRVPGDPHGRYRKGPVGVRIPVMMRLNYRAAQDTDARPPGFRSGERLVLSYKDDLYVRNDWPPTIRMRMHYVDPWPERVGLLLRYRLGRYWAATEGLPPGRYRKADPPPPDRVTRAIRPVAPYGIMWVDLTRPHDTRMGAFVLGVSRL